MAENKIFDAPFYVEVNKDDVVTIYDADDFRVTDYNTHTQIPLDDKQGQAEELMRWLEFAEWQVEAMNTYVKENNK